MLASSSCETIQEVSGLYGDWSSKSDDFEEAFDNLPSFVQETMTSAELLVNLRKIIMIYFNPLEVSFYLSALERSDILNMSLIMRGMKSQGREDIFDEMVRLWGYYLTLNDNPDREAFLCLSEIILNRNYDCIFDGLIQLCKKLRILSNVSRIHLIKIIKQRMFDEGGDSVNIYTAARKELRLSFSTWQYLYGIKVDAMEQRLKESGMEKDQCGTIDSLKVDAEVFESIIHLR